MIKGSNKDEHSNGGQNTPMYLFYDCFSIILIKDLKPRIDASLNIMNNDDY